MKSAPIAAPAAPVTPRMAWLALRDLLRKMHDQRRRAALHGRMQADLARLRRIQALGEAGMNLAGIERVLDLERQLDRATARVRELEREVARRSAEHERAMDATRRAMSTEIVHVRTAASPPAVRVKRVIPAGLRPVPRPTDTRDPRRSR